MLDRLIEHNDRIPLTPNSLTRFHSRAPPSIGVRDYLLRIARYTNVEPCCLLILLPYVDKGQDSLFLILFLSIDRLIGLQVLTVCARMNTFTISSLTVHRFIIAAVSVGSKALSDAFCTNGRYARVGGVSVVEMNLLEKEFCEAIDWRLTVSGKLRMQNRKSCSCREYLSIYRHLDQFSHTTTLHSSALTPSIDFRPLPYPNEIRPQNLLSPLPHLTLLPLNPNWLRLFHLLLNRLQTDQHPIPAQPPSRPPFHPPFQTLPVQAACPSTRHPLSPPPLFHISETDNQFSHLLPLPPKPHLLNSHSRTPDFPPT